MKNKNLVTVAGTIKYPYKEIILDSGKRLFATKMEVKRLSETFDEIPLVIPEDLIELPWDDKGSEVTIRGEFRSRNVDGHCELYVAVKELVYGFTEFENDFKFSGYICKLPTFRETPLGRKILDLFVAVNRGYGKTAYIPCVVWGDNACWGKNALNLGDYVECEGRIQSREYTKGEEVKIAYEVSVRKITKGVDPNADECKKNNS